MDGERTRRFKIGLSAEFEFLHLLKEHKIIGWHLRSCGDLIIRTPFGRSFAVDVKVVSTTKRNTTSYSRVYFRKEGTENFLKLCTVFNFEPILALKHEGNWYISYAVPTNFEGVKKHGTTIMFKRLNPIPLEKWLMEVSQNDGGH